MDQHLPIVQIDLPLAITVEQADIIEGHLKAEYISFDFQFSRQAEISSPAFRSFEPRGADLGSIDGDKTKPMEAIASGITAALGRIWRDLDVPK